MTPAELRVMRAKAPKSLYETFSVYGSGDYYIETDEGGRDFYEAAVNALPALIDLMEKVGEYIEINKTHMNPEEKFLAMCEAFDALGSK